MKTLKKTFIFFTPLILGAWSTASWAGELTPPTSVPEPSVLLLLAGGIGAGALARYLRKRK
jgi:hypothetical protein